jgi:hypothetical protein
MVWNYTITNILLSFIIFVFLNTKRNENISRHISYGQCYQIVI